MTTGSLPHKNWARGVIYIVVNDAPPTPTTEAMASAPDQAWFLAVRVATVASVLMVAIGYALVRFLGIGGDVVVALAVVIGLNIGWRLPAVRPDIGGRLQHHLPA